MGFQEDRIERLLWEKEVLREGHFVLTTGRRHSRNYFDKNRVTPHPLAMEEFCETLAKQIHQGNTNARGIPFDAVVSPAIAGAFIGQRIAYHLSLLQGKEVIFVYAEKDKDDEDFFIGRGQGALIARAAILLVEDVNTSGRSARQAAEQARSHYGIPAAGATLCNRGATPMECGLPTNDHVIYSLYIPPEWPTWAATEDDPCPLCTDHVPFDTDVGHAKEYLRRLAEQGILEPWMLELKDTELAKELAETMAFDHGAGIGTNHREGDKPIDEDRGGHPLPG